MGINVVMSGEHGRMDNWHICEEFRFPPEEEESAATPRKFCDQCCQIGPNENWGEMFV